MLFRSALDGNGGRRGDVRKLVHRARLPFSAGPHGGPAIFAVSGPHGAVVRIDPDVRQEALVATIPTVQRQLPTVASQPTKAATLLPQDVVKAAKARAAEIRVELRRMKTLQKQLVELDRLIAAAKTKPVAIVRNLDHARHVR